MTLEEYLVENFKNNIIDHAIRITSIGEDGEIAGYIHPSHWGKTIKFVIRDGEIGEVYEFGLPQHDSELEKDDSPEKNDSFEKEKEEEFDPIPF